MFFQHISHVSVLCLALLAFISDSHVIGQKDAEDHVMDRLAEVSLEERYAEPDFNYGPEDVNETSTKLFKRNLFNLNGNEVDDESILGQAFLDMQTLVTYVAQNPNAQVLARYFRPQDAGDVNAIFNTVMQMASTNPPATPPGQSVSRPMDLHDINVIRSGGGFPTLAESFDVSVISVFPQIKVYDFGWFALWQRLLRSIRCSHIGPKTNYKMHFLGSLLLHEVLYAGELLLWKEISLTGTLLTVGFVRHFNNVAIMAWNQGLPPNHCPHDQPGRFCNTDKAYGPYEAIQLLARSPADARLNIENYVWYALETFWLNRCPGSAPGGMFRAPKSNDIPVVCKQLAKGALANLWCWIS